MDVFYCHRIVITKYGYFDSVLQNAPFGGIHSGPSYHVSAITEAALIYQYVWNTNDCCV